MKLPICVLSIVFGLVSQNGLAAPLAPLKVHSDGHYLTTEDGQPFFWLGDTAWELFHRLNREEAVRYLDNRAKLGFNVVQAVAIAELDGVGTPNAYGHLPFDFARGPKDPEPLAKDGPDNDYWDHVDFVVREANARGIYVAMLPTWGRWWKESSVFTPESGRRYCAWLARRYREAGIVWVLGGDRWVDTPEERAIIDAMAAGLREGDGGRHLVTFHPRGGGTSSKCLPECDWIDFHMRQNGHGIDYPNDPQERYAGTLVEAQRVPAKPVIDGEPVYEGHPVAFKPDANGHTVAADVRRALYWDLFNGAFGHTYGHHSIWQMYDHGRKGVNRPLMTWKEALDEPGAAQLHFAKDLLLSHDFLARIPDPSLIVDDEVKSLVPGVGTRRFVATRDANGSYAFVYAPVGRPFAVDFANLKGERFRSAWMNPRDGTFTPWTAFARPATTRRFTPPTPGELLDWVLVVESVVTYEQFGAVGDGRTDDRAAIVKAHAVANERGLSVRAEDGRTYYLGPGEGTAVVKTDVDWGTAKFVIDDVNVVNRNSQAFRIESSRAPFAVGDVAPFRKGAAMLAVKLPCDCLLALENAKVRRYIRYGVNQNKGFAQKEVLLVRSDGSVDPGAPVIWDFDAVTKATAYPVDAKPLTVKGGVFTTIANQAESKYTYHSRGIEVNRSNVLLSGIRHEVTGELDDHGAPYGGFIQVRCAANVAIRDCVFTAHRMYWTPGHGGMSPMGSYDLLVNESANVSVVNCRQLTDIDDKRYWGLFASNYAKNILFDKVEFSRFDAHMGVANATILNSRLGHMGINAIGCGTFRVENTEIRGPGVFNLREDYGSTWEGDFIVRNCKLVANGPRGGQPYLVRGTYTGKHDFGYPCFMPRKVTFDGLVIDDAKHPKNYGGPYVFTDFNPKNTSADYVEDYPYHLTEEVVLKNVTTTSGLPVRLSPNKWMFRNVKVVR